MPLFTELTGEFVLRRSYISVDHNSFAWDELEHVIGEKDEPESHAISCQVKFLGTKWLPQ